jgi:hypothetical protein
MRGVLVIKIALLFLVAASLTDRLPELLPPKAGPLELLSSRTDKWPKEEDRHAIGSYAWAAKPGNAPLAAAFKMPAAELKCEAKILIPGAELDDGCLGGKAIALGKTKGCVIAEDKPGTPQPMGLFISWPGCGLQFKVGAMKGHTPTEARAAATEMAAWSAKLRP